MKHKSFLMSLIIILALALALTAACEFDESSGSSSDGDSGDDDLDSADFDYAIVDTDQVECFELNMPISCGSDFVGQDAQYDGFAPRYQDNDNGTITDLVTGLMWQQDPGDKMTYDEAESSSGSFSLAGYNDWRIPSIKELYSLILFSGEDPSGESGNDTSGLMPFIDDGSFVFQYGDTDDGDRIIDSQWVTTSIYRGTVMDGQECFFGVNFADGRIKCYPTTNKGYYLIRVRGNESYGSNNFSDNGDGTVSDGATGLLWQQADSGQGMNWEEALDYCESLALAGRDDWRLPNAKELQSIVDYSRSPDSTDSAAIDPVFDISSITNEAGQADYPFFWTGTTHVSSNGMGGSAAYVSFGRALGYMNGAWMDVHGAGAQRSDPKDGDPGDYPSGHGPQGDAIRIFNYVRCVANDDASGDAEEDSDDDVSDDDADDDMADDDADDDDLPAPPDEAVDACDGMQSGDPCEFVGMGGETVSGACEMIGDVLACAPEGGPPME